MIERVSGQVRQSSPIQRQKAAAEGGFGAMLQQGLARQTAEVAFSKHAMTRAEERGFREISIFKDGVVL